MGLIDFDDWVLGVGAQIMNRHLDYGLRLVGE